MGSGALVWILSSVLLESACKACVHVCLSDSPMLASACVFTARFEANCSNGAVT